MINNLKWFGTICIIFAAFCRSFEYHILDMIFSIAGAAVWGYAAIKTNDKALFVVNAFILVILFYGIFLKL